MGEWPLADGVGGEVPPALLRAEDIFLLWLMNLPLDADPAWAAHRLLASAPPAARDTAIQHRLRELLVETAQTVRAA